MAMRKVKDGFSICRPAVAKQQRGRRKVGDAMSLIILLPERLLPTAVDLALVRWGKDLSFGGIRLDGHS